jgi:hypothetical protein
MQLFNVFILGPFYKSKLCQDLIAVAPQTIGVLSNHIRSAFFQVHGRCFCLPLSFSLDGVDIDSCVCLLVYIIVLYCILEAEIGYNYLKINKILQLLRNIRRRLHLGL